MKLLGPSALVFGASALVAATAVSLRAAGDHEKEAASSGWLPAAALSQSSLGPVLLLASNATASSGVARDGLVTAEQTSGRKRVSGKKEGRRAPKDLAIIDRYVIIYWSVVIGCMIAMVACSYAQGDQEYEYTPRVDMGKKVIEIPENMWSAYFIAALGQMTFRHNEERVPALLVVVLAVTMGLLQIFTIFLIVHDIDPDAEPVTSVPASPWKETTWTINCMKWLMVVFLVMGLTNEVSDTQEVIRAMLEVSSERISVPMWSLWVVNLMHYTVTLLIIWGGVNAILSFAAVPDIVYSSLAITFLAHIDDISYTFFKRLVGIKSNFTVAHTAGERTKLPSWHQMALKMMLLLPMFWGMFLISRAYATNVMPAGRVRALKDVLSGMLGL